MHAQKISMRTDLEEICVQSSLSFIDNSLIIFLDKYCLHSSYHLLLAQG